MLARRLYGHTIVAPIIIIPTLRPPQPAAGNTHTYPTHTPTGTASNTFYYYMYIERCVSGEVKVNDDYYCREMCNYQLPEMASTRWPGLAGRICDFWFCTIYLALTVASSSPFAA